MTTTTMRKICKRDRTEDMDDAAFLKWMVLRLVHVYGEGANTDFVMRLKQVGKRVDEVKRAFR